MAEIAKKIAPNIRNIGCEHIKVNDEGIGNTVGIVWRCRKEIDDLDKAAKEMFKDYIIQSVEPSIYLINIEGENVILKCRRNFARAS